MTPFFVMWVCSMQNFNGTACNAISEAYFVSIDGQKTLDKANKKYLDPLPKELKTLGAIGGAYKQQKIHIGLNRHLSYEMGLSRDPNLDEHIVMHFLNFHMDFK